MNLVRLIEEMVDSVLQEDSDYLYTVRRTVLLHIQHTNP